MALLAPRITVDGPAEAGSFVVERLHIHEELGRMYRYDAYVLADSRDIALSKLLGQTVTIHVLITPTLTRHFGGHVMRATHLGGHGRSARYHLELRPWLAFLENSATCRIFQAATTPHAVDVLQKVFELAGFGGRFELNLANIRATRKWEYLVQYRETDLNFVMRLIEQEGYYFFFRQKRDTHELVLLDDVNDHDDALPGFERLRFAPSSTTAQLGEDVFERWSFSERLGTTRYELDDYDFKNARADLFSVSGNPAVSGAREHAPEPDATMFDYPGEYDLVGDGADYASVRLQEARVDRETTQALGNVRGLSAGSVFTLQEHPRLDQNRKYLVTALDMTIKAAQVESGRDDTEPVFRGSFSVIDAGLPYRLRRTTPKPVINGAQTAVVVGPEKDEIHTDSFGRVQVKFRWDRTGLEKQHENQKEEQAAPEDSSCFIRVSQPWASAGFGFQFLPRVGDEVVVTFLEGDPDRPLITGSVYNNVNMPPYTLTAHKEHSGIKTRSTKNGDATTANEIRFEDTKGEELLFVQAQHNHTVTVKNNRSLSVGGNENVSVSGTRDTSITKKNSDTFLDEHKLEVTKKVVEIFHDEHWQAVTKKQTIEITNDKDELVTGTYNLTTDTMFQLTQGGTVVVLKGDAMGMKIAKALSIVRGSGKMTIDESGAVSIESGTGIQLKCGSSVLELTTSGISLNGQTILANAGPTTALSLEAASATLTATEVKLNA